MRGIVLIAFFSQPKYHNDRRKNEDDDNNNVKNEINSI